MKIVTKKVFSIGVVLLIILLGVVATRFLSLKAPFRFSSEVPTVKVSSSDFVDSKRNVLNLVGALINNEFRARDGLWEVTLSPEKPLFLQVSLFSGNQYWFAAAASLPAKRLKLTLYDAGGRALQLDSWKDDGSVPVARIAGGIVAPQSGNYFVGLELLESQENANAHASLVYAYK